MLPTPSYLILATLPQPDKRNFDWIHQQICKANELVVDKEDLLALERAEQFYAHKSGMPSFKYSTNAEMLTGIKGEKLIKQSD